MEFLQYFSNVFSFGNLIILILGTIGGLLLGAAPGLSPTMAVALLIPFTFKMSPDQGLIMLGAVYTSTVADNHYGETIKAAVVLKDKNITKENEIIEHCINIIGKFKSPDNIYFLDELPKGSSGKIQRLKIKELI
jgi:acyl-CoA synthetase (AMP-forming)/AMP-acid ligase II